MRAVRNNLSLLLALAGGALCLIVSLSETETADGLRDAGRKTHGTIVRTWQEEATSRRGSSRVQNWVEVEFEAANGRHYKAKEKFADGLWTLLAVGMEMPVTYAETNPATNFIGESESVPLGGFGLALAFVCFSTAAFSVWRSLAVPPTKTLADALHAADDGAAAALFGRHTG